MSHHENTQSLGDWLETVLSNWRIRRRTESDMIFGSSRSRIWFFCAFFLVGNVHAELPKFLSFPFEGQHIIGNGWQYVTSDNGKPHGSIDIMCSLGTNVIAAADGLAVADTAGAGTIVIIKHNEKNGNGEYIYTLYGHLQSVVGEIPKRTGIRHSVNDQANTASWFPVKRGGKIGTCGKSNTSWTHVHFNVFAGSYKNACFPEDLYSLCKDHVGVKAFDPYDLSAIPADLKMTV